MDHTSVVSENMLEKYVSGALTEAEQESVEVHLMECDSCLDALHRLIDQKTMMDDYILRKLSPEQKVVFEGHYFLCDACFGMLKEREKLVVAIKEVDRRGLWAIKQNSTFSFSEFSEKLQLLFRQPVLVPVFAILCLVLLYPALRGLFIVPRLQEEIDQLRQPRANVAIHQLAQRRSPEDKIVLRQQNDFFLLAFDIFEKTVPSPTYRGEIIDQTGKIIWQSAPLQPLGEYETFTIACPAVFFSTGEYTLKVYEINPATGEALRDFAFPFTVEIKEDVF